MKISKTLTLLQINLIINASLSSTECFVSRNQCSGLDWYLVDTSQFDMLLLLHLHVNADSKSGKVSPISKLTLIKDIASLQQSEDVSKFTGADIDGWGPQEALASLMQAELPASRTLTRLLPLYAIIFTFPLEIQLLSLTSGSSLSPTVKSQRPQVDIGVAAIHLRQCKLDPCHSPQSTAVRGESARDGGKELLSSSSQLQFKRIRTTTPASISHSSTTTTQSTHLQPSNGCAPPLTLRAFWPKQWPP